MSDTPALQSGGPEFGYLSTDQLSQWKFILSLLSHSTKFCVIYYLLINDDFFLLQAFLSLLINIPEIRRYVTHAVQKLSLN